MQFLRSFTLSLLGLIATLGILLTPTVLALHGTLGSPEPIKQAIRNSGIYTSAPDEALNYAVKSQQTNQDPMSQQLLADQGLRDAIKRAFSPDFIQANTEKNIDAAYAWLSGKSDTLSLSVDTATARQRLITEVSTYISARAAKLPACTAAQLRTIDVSKDILNIPCLPPGFTPQFVADQLAKQIADKTTTGEATKTIDPTPQSTIARNVLMGFTRYYWILPAVTAFAVAAYVLLHRERLIGMRHLAVIALIDGMLSLASAFLIGAMLNRFAALVRDSSDSGIIQTKLVNTFTPLGSHIAHTIMWWGTAYIAVSIAALIIVGRLKHRHPAQPVSTLA